MTHRCAGFRHAQSQRSGSFLVRTLAAGAFFLMTKRGGSIETEKATEQELEGEWAQALLLTLALVLVVELTRVLVRVVELKLALVRVAARRRGRELLGRTAEARGEQPRGSAAVAAAGALPTWRRQSGLEWESEEERCWC